MILDSESSESRNSEFRQKLECVRSIIIVLVVEVDDCIIGSLVPTRLQRHNLNTLKTGEKSFWKFGDFSVMAMLIRECRVLGILGVN